MTTHLHIQTAFRNGKTVLANVFATSPLKVVNVTEDRTAAFLHAMLMSSSPGILEGDEYHLEIEIGEDCRFALETQSYQRLYTMRNAGATQQMSVHLGSNAIFTFLPHPLVPHIQTRFKSSAKIYLQTCGRKLNNEKFDFTLLHLDTEVFSNEKLVLKENMFLEPALCNPMGLGLWEGYTHHASLLLLGSPLAPASLSAKIVILLEGEPGIMMGISIAPFNGLVVRLLGNKAEQLHTCLKNIAALVTSFYSLNQSAYAG